MVLLLEKKFNSTNIKDRLKEKLYWSVCFAREESKEKFDTIVQDYSDYAIALFKDSCIMIEGNVENTVDLWNGI